jgi:integrase
MDSLINLNVVTIESLPIPAIHRAEYRVKKLPELRLRITPTGIKTFSVFKRVHGGKPVRVTLGKFPALSPTKARILTQQYLAELVTGNNPNQAKKVNELQNITVAQAHEKYIATKPLKQTTLRDYKTLVKCQLKNISNKRLVDITRDDVEKIHKNARSKARADYSMRLLRALINFMNNESAALTDEPLILVNPVNVLSHRMKWNNVARKNTHIRLAELPDFHNALEFVRANETNTGKSICDALLFALLTGLRKNEILNLKWSDINMRGLFFTIRETKNDEELELPITPALKKILDNRRKETLTNYVFSAENQYGQIRTPRKVVQKVKKRSVTNCDFHDLRRTFATTAEHLDIGTYKLKRLMNHASNRHDVTAGYTIMTAEKLRESAKKVQSKLLHQKN